MRALLPAPLLLTGCTLLYPTTTSLSMQHDGYELTCEDLGRDDCIRRGDALVPRDG